MGDEVSYLLLYIRNLKIIKKKVALFFSFETGQDSVVARQASTSCATPQAGRSH